jgi:hypothetical protein
VVVEWQSERLETVVENSANEVVEDDRVQRTNEEEEEVDDDDATK